VCFNLGDLRRKKEEIKLTTLSSKFNSAVAHGRFLDVNHLSLELCPDRMGSDV